MIDVRDFGLKPINLLVLSVAPLVRVRSCISSPRDRASRMSRDSGSDQPNSCRISALLARVNVGGVYRNVNIGLLEDGRRLARATGSSSTSASH
jgi:hypothetical protein